MDKVEGRNLTPLPRQEDILDGTGEPTKDEIIQSMAIAIATLDAELQALKEGAL